MNKSIIVNLYLLHQVGIQSADGANEAEDQPLDAWRLLILHKVPYVLEYFWVEKVRSNHEPGVLDDRNEHLDRDFSFLRGALILNTFEYQWKQFSHVRFDWVGVDIWDLSNGF